MTGFAGLDTVLRNRQRDRDRNVGRGRERKIKGESSHSKDCDARRRVLLGSSVYDLGQFKA